MVESVQEQRRDLSGTDWTETFERLEGQRAGREPEWLRTLRAEALASFDALGYPTSRLEEWRYTNVSPISRSSKKTSPSRTAAVFKEARSVPAAGSE